MNDKIVKQKFWISPFLLLLSTAISLTWGIAIGLKSDDGFLDFRAVYYGTRCLIEDHNPYNVTELESSYRANGGARATDSPKHLQLVTLFVNLPTTFVLVAPLAVLSLPIAETIWLCVLIAIFLLGAFAVWDLSREYAPGISLLLLAALMLGSELTFATANTAGIVIGLSTIAVWCFLRNRWVVAGTICLALALAIKPHDSGFIWLFFILAGGRHRKRAFQAFLMTACIGIAALLWVSHVAPNWMHDWSANLATISGPGGLNDPGPQSVTGDTAGMVVSLQAFLAVFRNDPHFYNPVSYLVCICLLAIWVVAVHKSRPSIQNALFALAPIVPLTMLITYHRGYDAKLLLVSIPACAILWSERSLLRWPALLITACGIAITSDISLAIIVNLNKGQYRNAVTGFFAQTVKAVSIRPPSIVLLLMAVLLLYVFARRADVIENCHSERQ